MSKKYTILAVCRLGIQFSQDITQTSVRCNEVNTGLAILVQKKIILLGLSF